MANAVQKEVDEIISAIRSYGFQVAKQGGAAVVLKNGEPARTPEGAPVVFHLTPSDARWRANLLAYLKRSNILDRDPLEPKVERAKRRAERNPFTAEQRQASREATLARGAANRERSDHLRERLNVLVDVLGGKERLGLLSRLGEVAWQLAEERGIKHGTVDATRQSVRVLLGGNTLNEWTSVVVETMLDALDQNPAVVFEEVLARYRAGRPASSVASRTTVNEEERMEAAPPLEEPEEPDEPVEPVVLTVVEAPTLPETAFRALALMAQVQGEMERAIEVAKDIARLELQAH